MDNKTYLREKLSKVLFLNVKRDSLRKLFNIELSEDIYLPISSHEMLKKVNEGENLDNIPVSFFVEGIFYVIGVDKEFKYFREYEEILKSVPSAFEFIKGKIYKEINLNNYEEAFILLKGLVVFQCNIENYDKLILLVDELRTMDSMYKAEEIEIIDDAKKIDKYALPYLYEGIIKKEEQNYEGALFAFNMYLGEGGEKTQELEDVILALKNSVNFEKGKTILYSEPKEAIKLFVPLLDEFSDVSTLYYYIAVAYRILENYEKAIYYLNEAITIDDNLMEAINELGLNYASLGNFDMAISCFRKAFEATKSVEICTNLIMCYMDLGKIQQAKLHLDIAKKLDKNDEVVMELDKILRGIE